MNGAYFVRNGDGVAVFDSAIRSMGSKIRAAADELVERPGWSSATPTLTTAVAPKPSALGSSATPMSGPTSRARR